MNAPQAIPPELANNPEYESLEELGRGGMGVVYKARNALMGRDEVLKVVGREIMAVPGAIDRFRQEIQSAARLDHANIVRAYSARLLGELLVFSMEYVPGVDLASLVKSRGPLAVVNTCYYAQQVANGLQHACDRGMVHRDIKPANLIRMVSGKQHTIKILDFGLAKITSEAGYNTGLTGAGTMLGTPDYIAPEQIVDAQSADTRADIYSLGCTIHFLLTGSPPFTGKSLYELLGKHQHESALLLSALRADVPDELAGVVAKMMAKNPADRFQTPGEAAKALGAFTKSGAVANPPRIVPAVATSQPTPFGSQTPVPATSQPTPFGSQTATPSSTTNPPIKFSSQTLAPSATRIDGNSQLTPPTTSKSAPPLALPTEPAEALPAEAAEALPAEALPAEGNVWSSQTVMPASDRTARDNPVLRKTPAEAPPPAPLPAPPPAQGNVWGSQTMMPASKTTPPAKPVLRKTARTEAAAERELGRYQPPPKREDERSGKKGLGIVLGLVGVGGGVAALILALWLSGIFKDKKDEGASGSEDKVPTYVIKRAGHLPGSKVFVKSAHKTTVTSENKVQDEEAERTEYVEQVIEETDGKPTKISRTYRNAQLAKAGKAFTDLVFAGNVIVIDLKSGVPTVTMGGRTLAKSESHRFSQEFDEPTHARNDAIYPRAPVKVGETWTVEKERIEEMNRGREIKYDVEKSSIVMTLTKVYSGPDSKEWARLEGKFNLVPANPKEKANLEYGTITGGLSVEQPTNGRSADRTLMLRLNEPVKVMRGEKSVLELVDYVREEQVRVELDENDVRNIIPQLSDPSASKRLAGIKRLVATRNVHAAVYELLYLLDDKDANVAEAAADALASVTSPSKSDIDAINAALEKKDRKNARLYAIKFYASGPSHKVPESLLPAIVALLADPAAEIRKSAVRILSIYGPGCKSKAFAAVFEHSADEDQTVAADASRLFETFAPFNEADRMALSARLASPKAQLRLTAVAYLAQSAPDAAKAQEWLQPRLKDTVAQIRLTALGGLEKWGSKSKDSFPDIITLFDDDTVAVAVAAVKAAAAIDSGTETVKKLARLIKPTETRAEVKAAAVDALLAIDLMDVATALPVLSALLDAEKPTTRTTALAKIAKFGKEAKPVLPAVAGRLKDEDAAVKSAALQVIGPFGPDAADAIPDVAALLDGKQPDALATLAAETLGKLGTKSIDPLIKALNGKLPKEALIRICEGLATYGKEAQAAGPVLLQALDLQKDLHALMMKATLQEPDPVAAALARVGGDSVVEPLSKLTEYTKKPGQKAIAAKGDDVMLWAIGVMGSLNPDYLSDKSRDKLADMLDTLSKFAPAQKCKDAAKSVKVKFPLKK